jgi:L-amino acid N-acyltransferase YncA
MMESLKQYIQHRDPRANIVFAQRAGMDVGLASYELYPEAVYLHEVFILSQYRKSGVGKELLWRVVEAAKFHERKSVVATVNTSKGDPDASLKACIACGFKIKGSDINSIVLVLEVQNG